MSVESVDRSIPDRFLSTLQEMELRALLRWVARDYTEAEELYKQLYEFHKKIQDEIHRPIHKGTPLHMIGMSLIPQNRMVEAIRWILLAYIEDTLNMGFEDEDEADRLPAASVLRDFFLVKLRVLGEIKRNVVQKKRDGMWPRLLDPLGVLEEIAAKFRIGIDNFLSLCRKVPSVSELQPLGFPQPWDRRVFIGGNYMLARPNLRKIAEAVILRGYTPVIADEVYIEKKWVHHHTLMLLHTCAYAIFDLTHQAGQLMEIERAPDYETKMLLVWAASSNKDTKRLPKWVTSMVRSMKKKPKFKAKGYTDFNGIPRIVSDFLPP